MALMMWKPLIDHPVYTLGPFFEKNHPVNFSNWESNDFKNAYHLDLKIDSNRKRAESLLHNEFPVIPLLYEEQRYIPSKKLRGYSISPIGRIDYKTAFFEQKRSNLNLPNQLEENDVYNKCKTF